MYRIICESYKNYMEDFSDNKTDFRMTIMLPFHLLLDLEHYKEEEEKITVDYKKLQDFIWHVKQSIEYLPRFKSLLWTLESRGICGKYYGESTKEELEEQIKIINMFLNLSYWD